jgi:hypothetical protein
MSGAQIIQETVVVREAVLKDLKLDINESRTLLTALQQTFGLKSEVSDPKRAIKMLAGAVDENSDEVAFPANNRSFFHGQAGSLPNWHYAHRTRIFTLIPSPVLDHLRRLRLKCNFCKRPPRFKCHGYRSAGDARCNEFFCLSNKSERFDSVFSGEGEKLKPNIAWPFGPML